MKFFASVRESAGVRDDVIELPEDATLRDLIDTLAARYGSGLRRQLMEAGQNQPSPHIQYLVDGENARQLAGYQTKMRDGVEVAVIPPVGGGFFTFG